MNTLVLGLPRLKRVHSDRVFFTGMATACALTVFIGFAPTYYLGRAGLPPLSPLVHLHAGVFTLWTLLFVTQTALVAAGRADVHRRLGIAAVVLASVMVILGIAVSVDSMRRGVSAPGLEPRVLIAIPLSSILTFAVLMAAAVFYRRRPAAHKRLMLLANMSLVSAAIGRVVLRDHLPVMTLLLFTDVFVVAAFVYDVARYHRVFPANAWGGALILSKPLFVFAAMSNVWLSFADRLR